LSSAVSSSVVLPVVVFSRALPCLLGVNVKDKLELKEDPGKGVYVFQTHHHALMYQSPFFVIVVAYALVLTLRLHVHLCRSYLTLTLTVTLILTLSLSLSLSLIGSPCSYLFLFWLCRGRYVKGLTDHVVASVDEIEAVMERGLCLF
jgi:hypothetical protein